MTWTTQQLQQLKEQGKIKDFTDKKPIKKHKPIRRKEAPQVMELKAFLTNNGIEFESEYKFHPTRKWRFDIAIPALMVAVEYEGIFAKKSRHTTITGYNGDVAKYNAATLLGWKVLRYTSANYKNFYNDYLTIKKQ